MKCDNHDGNDGIDSNHSNKCLNSKGSAPPQHTAIVATMSSV
jgi:hypothetical protein